MPRIVDHEQRRAHIAEAAWTVISRAGIEAASLQTIARELGCTTGSVTHYFSNKEELISFAFKCKTAAVFQGIESAARRLQPGLPRVRVALERMTPVISQGDAQGGQATLSYWGLAVSQPPFARLHRKSYATWAAMLQRFLAEAADLGQIPATADLHLESSILMSFADGLLVGAVLEPRRVTRAASKRMLDVLLSRMQRPASDPHG